MSLEENSKTLSVFVVIPNWNGEDIIAECLMSLEAQSRPLDIIVVDNGSTDNSVKIIEAQFPKVTLLKNKTNMGFAGGVNTGIRYALEKGATYVALFNNDAVAKKDWLDMLVVTLEKKPEVGIVTGKFFRTNSNFFDSTGEEYSIFGSPFPRGRNQKDIGQFDNSTQLFGATGGASLYRAKMLEEIGLFDERFFAYYEDLDISFRARLAGWEVTLNLSAQASHHIGATSSKHTKLTRFNVVKNFHLLYFKNMPGSLFWLYLPTFIIGSLLLFISSLRKGLPVTHIRGVLVAIKLLPSSLVQRQRVQKHRKASIWSINSLLYKKLPPRIPSL